MPGLSGVDLQAELAANGLKLPVILVTADDNEQTRKKARALKAAAFFWKPVDGSALLEAVVGQIYLVVVVAWLVGMHVSRKSK